MPRMDEKPLDRRIVVSVIGEGDYNDDGEYISGTVAAHQVWARRDDAKGEPLPGAGGVRFPSIRTFVVRWRADIAQAETSTLAVVDQGVAYNVTGLRDLDASRNRFLELDVEVVSQ